MADEEFSLPIMTNSFPSLLNLQWSMILIMSGSRKSELPPLFCRESRTSFSTLLPAKCKEPQGEEDEEISVLSSAQGLLNVHDSEIFMEFKPVVFIVVCSSISRTLSCSQPRASVRGETLALKISTSLSSVRGRSPS